MKKHLFIVDFLIFLLITIFFILPPLFLGAGNYETSPFTSWKMPLGQIILSLFFLLFYFFYIKEEIAQTKAYLFIFNSLFVFSSLFFISLIFQIISIFFQSGQASLAVQKPQGPFELINCIFLFLSGAVYEELLYRLYFPHSLILLFSRIKVKKEKTALIFIILAESLSALVFSLAHLYEGYLSVFNALIAHLILRYAYKKTHNIWYNISAHFLYNLLVLFIF